MVKNDYATKADIKKLDSKIDQAVDAILDGMDNMFKEQDKRNEAKFATKDDLKREVGFLHNDIKDLEAEFVEVPSRKQVESNTRRISVLEASL